MNDEQLIGALASLGIDEASCRTMLLLPLVQVAWADGRVQSAERELIVKLAGAYSLTPGDGARLLYEWLSERPTEAYFALARKVLLSLIQRQHVSLVDENVTLDDLIHMCEVVAESAGGLFGLVFTVHPHERQAVREIAEALDIEPTRSWAKLIRDAS